MKLDVKKRMLVIEGKEGGDGGEMKGSVEVMDGKEKLVGGRLRL